MKKLRVLFVLILWAILSMKSYGIGTVEPEWLPQKAFCNYQINYDTPGITGDTIVDPPAEILFDYGQNVLKIGSNKLRIDLSTLGANSYEEHTIEIPVYASDVGWVHYVMDPDWHGVLVLWEIDGEIKSDSRASYMIIHAGDESKVLLATAIHDDSGFFAVASLKGILLRTCENKGYYFPLNNALGINELEGIQLKIIGYDSELGQKAIEVRVSNATVEGIKVGINTREVIYLMK
ncbi:MAG: hypothetical protein M0Q51_09605 [Bacteroidales bacterium]|nr:hypothetical protein [Bacteroidales bacterium]